VLTLDDIWRRLTTEDIGFFPHGRREKIPTVPGVYAWFLPLRVNKGPDELLSLYRNISAYDAGCRGLAKWSTQDAGFRWDPLSVEVSRGVSVQLPPAAQQYWSAISADLVVRDVFRQALFTATIFSRPLYVGLTNNLSRRYHNHLSGAPGQNDFHSRFTDYMKAIGEALTLEQLLFACVPIRRSNDHNADMTEEQIALLESMLKVICQPVFGDK